jgi:hypothetical protein
MSDLLSRKNWLRLVLGLTGWWALVPLHFVLSGEAWKMVLIAPVIFFVFLCLLAKSWSDPYSQASLLAWLPVTVISLLAFAGGFIPVISHRTTLFHPNFGPCNGGLVLLALLVPIVELLLLAACFFCRPRFWSWPMAGVILANLLAIGCAIKGVELLI